MKPWNSGWLLSFDPGKASGISLGYYDDHTPYTLKKAWIVPGGADGFRTWWTEEYAPLEVEPAVVVSEKFKTRVGVAFADTTPLDVEQTMLEFGLRPHWQPPSHKSLCSDTILKREGLWQTGKDVNWTDGRDANDSTIHALVFLKLQRHIPTIGKYWPPRA